MDYTNVCKLTINNKTYYVHKYILDKCKLFTHLSELMQDKNIELSIPNVTIDFNIIIGILYDDKIPSVTPETYIDIIYILDYLDYTNVQYVKDLIPKIYSIMTDFKQIIDLKIDSVHKCQLLEYFMDVKYEKIKDIYTFNDVVNFLEYSHLMSVQLIDKIISKIEVKLTSIDQILNLKLNTSVKKQMLKNYLKRYKIAHNIILSVSGSSYVYEKDKFNRFFSGSQLETFQNHETHEGIIIICPSIQKFLEGLHITFKDYKLLYVNNKFSLYIDNNYISGKTATEFDISEILYDYCLWELSNKVE